MLPGPPKERRPFYACHPEFQKNYEEFSALGFDDRKLFRLWEEFNIAAMSKNVHFKEFVVGPVLRQRKQAEAAEEARRSLKLIKQASMRLGKQEASISPTARAVIRQKQPITPKRAKSAKMPKGKFDHLRQGKRSSS